VREHNDQPPLSVVERVPGIILALREHRRRVAHLLAGLDDVPTALSGTVVAELAERLRTDDDRLEVLVAHLEERQPSLEVVPVLAIRLPPLAPPPAAPLQRRNSLCMLRSST
jgi:hypothetical protein